MMAPITLKIAAEEYGLIVSLLITSGIKQKIAPRIMLIYAAKLFSFFEMKIHVIAGNSANWKA